jgi:hypothetical protein
MGGCFDEGLAHPIVRRQATLLSYRKGNVNGYSKGSKIQASRFIQFSV